MRTRLLSIAAAFAFAAVSCMQQEAVSLTLGRVPRSVDGNVVTIPVTVDGIEIVKADGDTSGDSGHFHVTVDNEPPAVGQTIPKVGVVHSADNPIKIYGIGPGEHTFHVVLGDGTHKRIHGDAHSEVTVDVKGPAVIADAPPTISEGDELTVDLEAEGVDVVKADGDTSGKTGHFHVLVDPAAPPKAGNVIPPAADNSPYAAQIIHSADPEVTVRDLKKGEHTIWVVLGDGAHKAFDPPAMDKLTVTVS